MTDEPAPPSSAPTKPAPSAPPAFLRAGDVVRHVPSGEEWLILAVSADGTKVHPAGWPATIANASDCVFVERRGLAAFYYNDRPEEYATTVRNRVGEGFGPRADAEKVPAPAPRTEDCVNCGWPAKGGRNADGKPFCGVCAYVARRKAAHAP